MSKGFDMGSVGAPRTEHRHHRIREFASLIAAVSGALAALVVGGIIVGGPSTWTLIALPLLLLVWLTGLWWRWDSPDRRKKTDERERRGF
jgi:membrane protein implicated in regulation of membrane protease activity